LMPHPDNHLAPAPAELTSTPSQHVTSCTGALPTQQTVCYRQVCARAVTEPRHQLLHSHQHGLLSLQV
jgi:hypothetical protein